MIMVNIRTKPMFWWPHTLNETDHITPSEYWKGERLWPKSVSLISGKVYVYVKFSSGECVINEEKLEYDDNLKDVWIKNRQTVGTGRELVSTISSNKKKKNSQMLRLKILLTNISQYDKMNDIFSNFELK